MKKIFLSLILVYAVITSNAQSPTFQWANSVGGATNDESWSVTNDASGNIFTAGYFTGIVDFDPGPGTSTLTSVGMSDIFISKLDPSGNFIWAKNIGGASNDLAFSVVTDAAGNVYATGNFTGTVDFDPNGGVVNLTSTAGGAVFILKLNSSGNFVWAKNIGGTAARCIKLDPNGNVYTAGSFTGTADFDPGAGTSTLTSAGMNDIFVSKLDGSGNFVWARGMGGTLSEYGYSLGIDGAGDVYTTGWFDGTADFDPGAGTSNLISAGGSDIYISKLNSSGNFVWAKNLGGATVDFGWAIAVNPAGDVYTTGYFTGTADFDPGVGTSTFSSAGGGDIFVSKLDVSGNFVWAKRMGGLGGDGSYGITLDVFGNVFTTGGFGGTVDFDPGAGTNTLTPVGMSDVFISKLDAAGNFVWAKSMGSTAADFGYSILADASGNVYTTGIYAAIGDFDPGAGVVNLTPLGGTDIFLQKLGQCVTPNAPINATPTGEQNICINNSATLAVSGTGTISWYSTPTSTAVLGTGTTFITPTLSVGTYTYYAEALVCLPSAARAAITITVSACTGIQNFSLANEPSINIYPNPTHEILNVELEIINSGKINIQILSVLGDVLMNETPSIHMSSLNIQHLFPGLYFVKVILDNKIISTQKIVKE